MLARVMAGLALAGAGLLASGGGAPTAPGGAAPAADGLSYLPQEAAGTAVLAAGGLRCSLLDTATGNGAAIAGQDGGWSYRSGDAVYWVFSDTLLTAAPTFISNSVATSAAGAPAAPGSDGPAGTPCFAMTHLQDAGVAREALGPASDGCGAWPTQPVSTDTGASGETGTLAFIHVPAPPCLDRGAGIGRLDTGTLRAERLVDVVWPGTGVGPLVAGGTPFRADEGDGDYVYFVLITGGAGDCCQTTATALARVAPGSFEDPAAYGYWSGTGWVTWGKYSALEPADNARFLWRQQSFGIQAGVSMTYLPHIGRWAAVYATGIATQVRIRTAERLTGPWSQESVLIDCWGPQLGALPAGPAGVPEFRCYTGQLHEELGSPDGLAIYASFARLVIDNSDYRVYVHGFNLASAVWEWRSADGKRRLVPGDASGDGTREGLAFFASEVALPGFEAVHEFESADDVWYGDPAAAPQGYAGSGVAFYAPDAGTPAGSHHSIEPVHRVRLASGEHAYTTGPLPDGGTDEGIAFYAIVPDPDDDGDGTADADDNCPLDAWADQSDSDGDGAGDACDMDRDNDYVPNSSLEPGFVLTDLDNCPLDYNPTQEDSDRLIGASTGIPGDDRTVPNGDFPGDVCDADDDNDGLPDGADADPGGDITYDDDGDGQPAAGCLQGVDGDGSDDGPSWDANCDAVRDGVVCTAPALSDADADGLRDRWEVCTWGSSAAMIDSDGDGMSDCREVVDVSGDGAIGFVVDLYPFIRGVMLPAPGKDGVFDLDGDNKLSYLGDLLPAVKLGLRVTPSAC